jgi:hypothetical protein
MAAPKGHPRYGGRAKGALNRKDRLHQQALAAAIIAAALTPEQLAELSPLEVMRAIMRHRFGAGDYDGALAAAREAAPYVHAKLSSAEVKVSATVTASDDELAREITVIEGKLAASRLLS